jgi:hypothetical protein
MKGKGNAHLVGVIYSKDVAGNTRSLSLSRRYCRQCGRLALAVRGLAPSVVLVEAIRASIDAGVDLEPHRCEISEVKIRRL